MVNLTPSNYSRFLPVVEELSAILFSMGNQDDPDMVHPVPQLKKLVVIVDHVGEKTRIK